MFLRLRFRELIFQYFIWCFIGQIYILKVCVHKFVEVSDCVDLEHENKQSADVYQSPFDDTGDISLKVAFQFNLPPSHSAIDLPHPGPNHGIRSNPVFQLLSHIIKCVLVRFFDLMGGLLSALALKNQPQLISDYTGYD